MNYIKHLTGFFEKVAIDNTLNPSHISLYMALFQFWNSHRFSNPISISRDEVMRISKVSSKSTYHKCLWDLHNRGYIDYKPSHNPFKGSLIYLFDFSDSLKPIPKNTKETKPKIELVSRLVDGQVLDKHCTAVETSTETSTEQALVSYINNTNYTNNSKTTNSLNLEEHPKNFQDDNLVLKEKRKKEKKSAAKKKEKNTATPSTSSRANHLKHSRETKEHQPTLNEIKSYFLQENFPELEANKFFNYFSSIGWLVGGKSPMVDWKAAAQNWMINSNKFNPIESPPDRAKHLNVGNDKDYSEPL